MKKMLAVIAVTLTTLSAYAANFNNKTFSTRPYHFPRKTGLVRTPESRAFLDRTPKKNYLETSVAIPGKADISSLVSLPENQGNCGSCWDFSLTKALRSAHMVAGHDPGVLAFNYLLYNCGPGPAQSGCNGGDFNAAGNFENGAGPWLEAQDPYSPGRFFYRCKNYPTVATSTGYTMLGTQTQGPSFKDLAYEVGVKHQMVSIDVAASMGSWSNYSSGIYNDCQGTANDIDHMIDLVGYNCETSVDSHGQCVFDQSGRPINQDGYLLVENNWGESWGTTAANGHGGYMNTRMYDGQGNNCNAIATDALVFTLN